MKTIYLTLLTIAILIATTSPQAKTCNPLTLKNTIPVAPLWADLSYLASDELKGRKVGSEGNLMAQQYLQKAFEQTGLQYFEDDYRHPFVRKRRIKNTNGTNIIGWLPGHEFPQQYTVITAHFDHLGNKGREIFNGADDNASGVAALLALSRKIKSKPLRHSIIFVATDAEEGGLHGAKAFVANPPVAIDKIKYNFNIDMISHSGSRKKLYLAGGRASPQLADVINKSIEQASLCLVAGHDGSGRTYDGQKRINWRKASDHYPFHRKGIPYLFFSVNDHRFYHTSRDTIERVNKPFYIAAVETIYTTLTLLDQQE